MTNTQNGWTSNIKEPYARIWWRTANISYPWALLEVPYIASGTQITDANAGRTEIANTIKKHFSNKGENIYVCFYKTYNLTGFKIVDPTTENYNYEYSIVVPIDLAISQTSNGSVKDI
jgi:hypothetical protein